MELLAKAISIATEAHEGQFDKAGFPYIAHPFRVMLRLHNEGAPEFLLCAAILHDTVEDTNVTLDDLTEIFGERIAEIVDTVSRRDESYPEFIQRIKDSGDTAAIALKLADITDNTDPRRPRIEKLIERYEKARKVLLS